MRSMPSNMYAPWAEVVPDAPYPMRVADLAGLPDDGRRYEIVEGRLVRMPGSASQAARIAMRLVYFLMAFTFPRKLGDVTGPDGTYDLTQPGDATETALIPDVAFVQAGRLPAILSAAAKQYPRLAPDLAAEVVSPSQGRTEMDDKARLYLDRDVRLVWVIWPDTQTVDVWRPGADTPVATLGANDQLDGLDVIPGFICPVADLFA